MVAKVGEDLEVVVDGLPPQVLVELDFVGVRGVDELNLTVTDRLEQTSTRRVLESFGSEVFGFHIASAALVIRAVANGFLAHSYDVVHANT